ncbi:MAG: hypothetical protein FWG79_08810 [Bacteroidales bacterium]|nr:hypothetical protein [Bacteroidales bacterium]
MEIKSKTKEVAANWMLDVAKFILTGAVITSFLGQFNEKWFYGIGILSVGLLLFIGLSIINKNE